MEQIEEWRPVKGYEGLYEVSDLGRVRSLDRVVIVSTDESTRHKRILRGMVLSNLNNKNGYLFVSLSRDGILKRHYIHRLVAIAFIPNPNNYPIINHKDETRDNNRVDNLEWCTQFYNINYGNAIKKIRDFNLSDKNPNKGRHRPEKFKEKVRKPILQFNRDGIRLVREWDSARTAGDVLGICASTITAVCRGRCQSYKNFIWRYKYDYPHTKPNKSKA